MRGALLAHPRPAWRVPPLLGHDRHALRADGADPETNEVHVWYSLPRIEAILHAEENTLGSLNAGAAALWTIEASVRAAAVPNALCSVGF